MNFNGASEARDRGANIFKLNIKTFKCLCDNQKNSIVCDSVACRRDENSAMRMFFRLNKKVRLPVLQHRQSGDHRIYTLYTIDQYL